MSSGWVMLGVVVFNVQSIIQLYFGHVQWLVMLGVVVFDVYSTIESYSGHVKWSVMFWALTVIGLDHVRTECCRLWPLFSSTQEPISIKINETSSQKQMFRCVGCFVLGFLQPQTLYRSCRLLKSVLILRGTAFVFLLVNLYPNPFCRKAGK